MKSNATMVLRRRSKTGEDSYGNDIVTSTETDPIPVIAHPRLTDASDSEGGSGRRQVVSGLVVYNDSTELMRSADAVFINGIEYEIDGEPGDWVSLSQGVRRQEAALKRVTG